MDTTNDLVSKLVNIDAGADEPRWSEVRDVLTKSRQKLTEQMAERLGSLLKKMLVHEAKSTDRSHERLNVCAQTVVHLLRSRDSSCRDELEAADRLSSKVIRELFHLVLGPAGCDHDEALEALDEALLEAFQVASKKTIQKVAGKKFWRIVFLGITCHCSTFLRKVLPLVDIVIDKLSKRSREMLLPRIAFKLKCLIRSPAVMSDFARDKLMQVYFGHQLENSSGESSFDRFYEACNTLPDDECKFDNCDVLKVLANHVKAREINFDEILCSDIARKLTRFFYSEERDRPLDMNLKAFLMTFLEITDEGMIGDSSAFRKLASTLIDAVQWCHIQVNDLMLGSCCSCASGECAVKIFKELAQDILKLLDNLCFLNDNWYRWFDRVTGPRLFDRIIFQSRQLTATTERILRDCNWENVNWFLTLVSTCPLAFPLSIRRKLLLTCLAIDDDEDLKPFIVSRDDIIENLEALFKDGYDHVRRPWSYSFKGELGVGIGPTKEFYSLISLEFQHQKYDMWEGSVEYCALKKIEDDSDIPEGCKTSSDGLRPKLTDSYGKSKLFYLLGLTMAKVLIDEQMLDMPLSEEFFRRFFFTNRGLKKESYYDIPQAIPLATQLVRQLILVKKRKEAIQLDPNLTESEKHRLIERLQFDNDCSFDDLGITFTVPGHPEIPLVENGEDIMLSSLNIELYLDSLNALAANESKVKSFQVGFGEILSLDFMRLFDPDELVSIFCGEHSEKWTVNHLKSCCIVKNGYTIESKAIQFLFEVLSSFDDQNQRSFLRFLSGRSTLPCGGLLNLRPRMTIAQARTDAKETDCRLPTASTCFNLLWLPDYSSIEVTREKLLYAINEGRDSFQII